MSRRDDGRSRPWRKGEAESPPEPVPAVRMAGSGRPRRVCVNLDIDTYVAFKAFVAGHGISGEQALTEAVCMLLREGFK